MKTKSLRRRVPRALFLSFALWLACGRGPAEQEHAGDEEAHDGAGGHGEHADRDDHVESGGHADADGELVESEARVALRAADLERFGVRVHGVGPGHVDSGIELLGEVRPNGDRLAHIVPRYPGVVREVLRSVGDRVSAGDVLMRIESNEGLSVYPTRAQLAGTVIARDVAVGEAVDRDKQAFVIADLSSVWIDLAVYQKDLPAVREGQRVIVHGGEERPDAEGDISYLTPVVDEPSRTAIARVVLANTGGEWRPGLFVTARLVEPAEAAVVAPRSALQRIDGRTSVFVETAEGFAVRAVTVGREGERLAEIVSGLAAGERVASENSFLLKAELGKGAAEHAH
jgi:cobalt-zinc-cadmium efflux system membrane fusion protein